MSDFKIMTYDELESVASIDQQAGKRGWTKAKCLDEKSCNTITVFKGKCSDGVCAKCGGKTKRTTWSGTAGYIIKDAQ